MSVLDTVSVLQLVSKCFCSLYLCSVFDSVSLSIAISMTVSQLFESLSFIHFGFERSFSGGTLR